MIKLRTICEITKIRPALSTQAGSPIRRFKNLVGKAIGGCLYVHKFYAGEVIPKDILAKAEEILTKSNPEFNYNCIMWNVQKNIVRFDEAPDFDSAREPHVGKYVVVSLDGANPPQKGSSNSIWHHKWLWVKDDYTGFDVDKSKEWSKIWLSKLKEPAKGSDPTWNSQLKKYNLSEAVRTIALADRIQELEAEWERLDSTGTGHSRQMQIQRELQKLWAELKYWQDLYDAVANADNKGIAKVQESKLVMEAQRVTPKQLEEFLREQIKGTEWDGKVFAVGGFVRDLLLGKEPKDLDIVISVNQGGFLFTKWLGQKLGIYKEGSNPVIFPTFGTANLRLDGVTWKGVDLTGEAIDAVMFRKEQYHDPNSRKPVVQFTPYIEVDAQRRDITFNALYLDIASGEILDPTGMGKNDLKAGIVRTAIDPSIIYTDDALRMFRAIRIATQLGFELAPEIVDGIKKNLHRLGNTSKERVRDELDKILLSKDPVRGMHLLRDTGLLTHIAKELHMSIGMTQNAHHTDDVFDHTLAVLKNTQPVLVQRLMGLFHDIGKVVTRSETPTGVHFYGHEEAGPEIVEKIMRNLKYPIDLIQAVKLGVRNHMRLKHGNDEANISDKTLRKFKIELGDQLENVLNLIHADNISHADASAMPNQIARVRERLKALDVQVKKSNLPITGHDLIQMGIKPGLKMGEILGAITDAWYENPNITREQAINIAQSMI